LTEIQTIAIIMQVIFVQLFWYKRLK